MIISRSDIAVCHSRLFVFPIESFRATFWITVPCCIVSMSAYFRFLIFPILFERWVILGYKKKTNKWLVIYHCPLCEFWIYVLIHCLQHLSSVGHRHSFWSTETVWFSFTIEIMWRFEFARLKLVAEDSSIIGVNMVIWTSKIRTYSVLNRRGVRVQYLFTGI